MAHPSESRLASHAAGKILPEVAAHLDSGCRRCREIVDIYRMVTGSFESMAAETEISDDVVDQAIALYRPDRLRRRPSIALRLAELVFDSLRQPHPAGARDSLLADRQLLYRVRGFDIDLRIRHGDRAEGTCLTGQILPDDHGFLAGDRLEVFMTGADGRMASLPVTEFGEFRADGLSEGSLILDFVVDGSKSYRLSFAL